MVSVSQITSIVGLSFSMVYGWNLDCRFYTAPHYAATKMACEAAHLKMGVHGCEGFKDRSQCSNYGDQFCKRRNVTYTCYE